MMVVAIHTFISDCHSVAVRQVMNAAVPLFIAISGFFLSKKNISTKSDHFTLLKRQIPKVYIPTLIFSLPFFALAIHSGESAFKSVVNLFICGFSIYYFIAFIIQCYVALPFVTRLESKSYKGGGNLCDSDFARMGDIHHMAHDNQWQQPSADCLRRSASVLGDVLCVRRCFGQKHNAKL